MRQERITESGWDTAGVIMGFPPAVLSDQVKRKGLVALGPRFEERMWLIPQGMRNG